MSLNKSDTQSCFNVFNDHFPGEPGLAVPLHPAKMRSINVINSNNASAFEIWLEITAVAVSLQTFYSRKPHGLNGALQEVGITFEGREHSGNFTSLNSWC